MVYKKRKKDLYRKTNRVTISSLHDMCSTQQEVSTMNKSEIREANKARLLASIGYHGAAARSLSALIRCAMTKRSKLALLAVARELHVDTHPEFII
jgi:hypothetical protein